MKIEIKDGELRLNIAELAKQCPELLRAAARTALFDEDVITAIIQLLLTGEVQWNEDDNPWWCTRTGAVPWMEKARQELAEHTKHRVCNVQAHAQPQDIAP